MDHKVSMISRREFLIGAAGTAGALLIHSCGDGTSGSASESPAVVMLEDVPLQAWHPETARFHPGVDRVLEILRDKGTPLLRTTASHPMGGTGGIISPDDVVVIKVNGVGQFVSSTNTDILGGLVARILDHPDGFEGEVVIVDKYFFYTVPTRGEDANAEVREQNFDFVADALGGRVTTYMFGRMWPPWSWLPWGPGSLVFRPPVPYDPEPWTDGYVDLMTLFPEDPAFYCLSYPRFTTARGTRIDLRRGVYEGGGVPRSAAVHRRSGPQEAPLDGDDRRSQESLRHPEHRYRGRQYQRRPQRGGLGALARDPPRDPPRWALGAVHAPHPPPRPDASRRDTRPEPPRDVDDRKDALRLL